MSNPKAPFLKIINGSGFLLQMRVEQDVADSISTHAWEPFGSEHRWFDPLTNEEEFIDLILGRGLSRMVVECKRETDTKWIFVVPKPGIDCAERARFLWTHANPEEPPLMDWHDFTLVPPSYESSYCIVQKSRPPLESTASLVVRATEALAREELTITQHSGAPDVLRIYIPVVITTAELSVCEIDPKMVGTDSGEVGDAEFKPVQFIRFRKGFGTSVEQIIPPRDLPAANRSGERTVLIIQANELIKVLKQTQVLIPSGRKPWDAIRGLQRQTTGR